jgi:hypothetical protein
MLMQAANVLHLGGYCLFPGFLFINIGTVETRSDKEPRCSDMDLDMKRIYSLPDSD